MHQISHYDRYERRAVNASGVSSVAPPLVTVLWRQKRTLFWSVGVTLFLAVLYLIFATRIYLGSAKVLVEQDEPATLTDGLGHLPPSESYVQTQADVFQSSPLLARALESVNYRTLNTFADCGPDPVTWLRKSGALKVDVAKKSDVVVISMESPYAQEAADFANAVVHEYIEQQTSRKRAVGKEMTASLEKEKEALKKKRDATVAAMEEFKRNNDVASFGTDRANTGVERMGTLAASLTTAEMVSFDLRSQFASINAALANPASLSAFVEAQQFKSKETGDREYDDLRSQLIQEMLALSTSSALEGHRNSRVMTLQSVVDGLKQRIAEKEHTIAAAHLISITTQLAAAEENEKQIRKAMEAQRAQLINLGPTAAAYANLDAELIRIQKQLDSLDARIAQVNVNELGSAPLNVQFLEPARAEIKPIKPSKPLILVAAMMLGWVIGIGLALGREWHEARFRSPQEVMSLLGTSVLATVPRINGRLSSVARGQILSLDSHSPSAEAYRSVRTSLHLGAFRDAKTIVLCSPTAGDGKSTTASNLAIAFAQAGQRTLLIDCDMREPVQHLIFEMDGALGLSSVIAGEAGLKQVIQETRVERLYLLPCGPIPANPTELLQGKRFGKLMRTLLASFDRIIIDTPPLMMVADGRILAASADATLLVLRMHQSMHRTAVQAMEDLDKVGAHVIGAIANDMPASRGVSSYYRGSWQYASSAKRVMAAIASSESGETATIVRRLPAPGTLDIEEPDWSCDEPFTAAAGAGGVSKNAPSDSPDNNGANGREW